MGVSQNPSTSVNTQFKPFEKTALQGGFFLSSKISKSYPLVSALPTNS